MNPFRRRPKGPPAPTVAVEHAGNRWVTIEGQTGRAFTFRSLTRELKPNSREPRKPVVTVKLQTIDGLVHTFTAKTGTKIELADLGELERDLATEIVRSDDYAAAARNRYFFLVGGITPVIFVVAIIVGAFIQQDVTAASITFAAAGDGRAAEFWMTTVTLICLTVAAIVSALVSAFAGMGLPDDAAERRSRMGYLKDIIAEREGATP